MENNSSARPSELALSSYGSPLRKPVIAIFTAQCNLAKRKFRLRLNDRPGDADPVAPAWREELQLLRQPLQTAGATS